MALTFSFCLSGFVCDCQWLRFFFSPPFFPMDELLEATRPLSLSPQFSFQSQILCWAFQKSEQTPGCHFVVVVGFALLRTKLDTRAVLLAPKPPAACEAFNGGALGFAQCLGEMGTGPAPFPQVLTHPSPFRGAEDQCRGLGG